MAEEEVDVLMLQVGGCVCVCSLLMCVGGDGCLPILKTLSGEDQPACPRMPAAPHRRIAPSFTHSQAPRSRDLSPSLVELMCSAPTSILLWPAERRADGTHKKPDSVLETPCATDLEPVGPEGQVGWHGDLVFCVQDVGPV